MSRLARKFAKDPAGFRYPEGRALGFWGRIFRASDEYGPQSTIPQKIWSVHFYTSEQISSLRALSGRRMPVGFHVSLRQNQTKTYTAPGRIGLSGSPELQLDSRDWRSDPFPSSCGIEFTELARQIVCG